MRNMAVLHSPAFSYPLPVLVRVLSNLLIFKGKTLYYNKYRYIHYNKKILFHRKIEITGFYYQLSVRKGAVGKPDSPYKFPSGLSAQLYLTATGWGTSGDSTIISFFWIVTVAG